MIERILILAASVCLCCAPSLPDSGLPYDRLSSETQFVRVDEEGWPYGTYLSSAHGVIWASCAADSNCVVRMVRVDEEQEVLGSFSFFDKRAAVSTLARDSREGILLAASRVSDGVVARLDSGSGAVEVLWRGTLGDYPRVQFDDESGTMVVSDRYRFVVLDQTGVVLQGGRLDESSGSCLQGDRLTYAAGSTIRELSHGKEVRKRDLKYAINGIACLSDTVLAVSRSFGSRQSVLYKCLRPLDEEPCEELLLPESGEWRIERVGFAAILWNPDTNFILKVEGSRVRRLDWEIEFSPVAVVPGQMYESFYLVGHDGYLRIHPSG